ncbi:hypothetical protein CEXT_568741 [Caerostris extrusa]|uniref:Chitin-binding type-2 domain-containing protein n=1 Tax=Caerostris extrusa TaxID=172846 RepID=A0AAV4WRG4_CAEEX|nr:hypothetical protein CEXT_568741 [Caerostris extrusa]
MRTLAQYQSQLKSWVSVSLGHSRHFDVSHLGKTPFDFQAYETDRQSAGDQLSFDKPSCQSETPAFNNNPPSQSSNPPSSYVPPQNPPTQVIWISSNLHLRNNRCPPSRHTSYMVDVSKGCRMYYKCQGGLRPRLYMCPGGKVFNKNTLSCEMSAMCNDRMVYAHTVYKRSVESTISESQTKCEGIPEASSTSNFPIFQIIPMESNFEILDTEVEPVVESHIFNKLENRP